MTHTGYTIQMIIKNITVHFKDGSSFAGQIFVSEYSRLHAGEEKISEFFENENRFFPFKIGANILLFSKDAILFVEYESDEDLSVYKSIPAQIILINGSIMSVSVPIMVANPAARLSDQINVQEKFLQCIIPGNPNNFIINKSNIISIKELS